MLCRRHGCRHQRAGSGQHTGPDGPTVAGTGKITFGTDFDKDTLLISKPKKTFPKGVKKIAWSAQFVEPAGVTTLHLVFAKVGKGGSESIVDSSNVGISNPALDLVASKADLAGIAGHKVGVYRLRYLGGDRVLAEGTFRLVK